MEKDVIGIAVGRNTHTLLVQEDGNEFVEKKIPNCLEGVDKVVELGASRVVIAGNKKWASPLAHALGGKIGNERIFYLSFKTDPNQRGQIGKIPKLLKAGLEQGMRGRPFFDQRTSQPSSPQQEPTAEIYQLAVSYHGAGDEVRTTKHLALNHMALLFPEAVKVPQMGRRGKEDLPVPQPQPSYDIWTKKMRPVLENPIVEELEQGNVLPEIKVLAGKSIAKAVPLEIRRDEAADLQEVLSHLDKWQSLKQEKINELRTLVEGYPLVQDFGGKDLISVLAGLLSWRSWPNWRELRSYCGLAVTRIDGKGNPRIARKRPIITSYLYLIGILTDKGKEVSRQIGEVGSEEEKRRKLRRVKRIERLLKYMWKFYLRTETNPKI